MENKLYFYNEFLKRNQKETKNKLKRNDWRDI